MNPVRLPEGGRAALCFPFDTNWDKTQKNAMYGATRRNILRNWSGLPQFMRRDQGFQCLMDTYCPVDEETFDLQQKRIAEHQDKVVARIRDLFGNRFDPSKPITDEEVIAAVQGIPMHRACVDFGVSFGGGTVILTNSTTRTVVGIQTPAQQAVRIWGLDIGFDGTTSTNGPAICELDTLTWATNPPTTNSVAGTTGKIDSGRPETIQSTSGKAWTTEPTVLTTVETFFIPNYMGSGIVFTPLTKPFVAKGGNGCSLRITQQSGITGNATGTQKCEE